MSINYFNQIKLQRHPDKKRLPGKIGLIAGSGKGPAILARCAQKMGVEVISVLLCEDPGNAIAESSSRAVSLGVGQTGKILKLLGAEGVNDVVMMGKINKEVIFNKKALDLHALKLLGKMAMRDDASIMNMVIEELEKEGITVLNQTLFLNDYLPGEGLLSRRKPTISATRDIAFGFPIAKRLAGMEIGQTIVVKERSVVAVESMEGSDNAIRRGCEIGGKGSVIIKVSRPNQDRRFDVPTVGLTTIQAAIEGKAAALAVEAGRMFFLEREEALKEADKNKLSVSAHSAEEFA